MQSAVVGARDIRVLVSATSAVAFVGALGCWAPAALAQGPAASPTQARIAAQAEAMQALAWMDGKWQGNALRSERGGQVAMTQTERVGPFLDGSVKVVEGKAFDAAGKPNGFNALGVIGFDPDKHAYTFTTWAQGYAQVVPLEVTPTGWSWAQAAGPGREIRYTASNEGGFWTERGVMTGPNMPPKGVEIFSMTLTRTGKTDWPAAGGFMQTGALPAPVR